MYYTVTPSNQAFIGTERKMLHSTQYERSQKDYQISSTNKLRKIWKCTADIDGNTREKFCATSSRQTKMKVKLIRHYWVYLMNLSMILDTSSEFI